MKKKEPLKKVIKKKPKKIVKLKVRIMADEKPPGGSSGG